MLNCVCLVGRLTITPELKYTPSGVPFTRFTLAVARSYVRAGEERQTDFIDIVIWRKTAEFACRYFKKGQMAAIDGTLQTRSYDAPDGTKRKSFEVVANNIHFTESKRNADDAVEQHANYDPSGATVDSSSTDNNESISNKNETIDSDLLEEEDLPF